MTYEEAFYEVALFERRVASRLLDLERAVASGNQRRVMRAKDRLSKDKACLAACKIVLSELLSSYSSVNS